MRALVIGADGFAGRWLVSHLRDSGDDVHLAVGPRFADPPDGSPPPTKIDVRDADAMVKLLDDARPEAVYLLAGVSGRETREEVDTAIGVSVIGSMNTLLASSRLPVPPRLLFVSTGYVYRAQPEPITEDGELAPASVYAAAKLAAERALTTLGPAIGVEVVIARAFNHIGPGQRDSFLVPTIARQVAEAARAGRERADIHVRDATVVRDFSDVRDVVRAYRLLVEHGDAGRPYNVASGHGVSVPEIAEGLAHAAGISVGVASDAQPAGEAEVLIGDASRLRGLGWVPSHELVETLRDILAQ